MAIAELGRAIGERNAHPFVEYKALSFKCHFWESLRVANNANIGLINTFKTTFAHEGWSFFASAAASATSHHGLIFKIFV